MSYSNTALIRRLERNALARWYQEKPAAARLQQQIERDLAPLLDDWFGYHMVIAGIDIGMNFSQMSRVQHITRLIPDYLADSEPTPTVVGSEGELPFASESIDALVLIHAFDGESDAHPILREAQRVLTARGQLLIVNINRLSGLGIWRSLRYRVFSRFKNPWRIPSPRQLEDWLHLLDFSVARARHKLVLPVDGKGRIGRWLAKLDEMLVGWNTPLGSIYLLHATKIVRGHLQTPVSTAVRRPLMGLPVSKPAAGAQGQVSPRQPPSLRIVE